MKKPVFTKAFERDKDLCVRRGWNMEKFKTVARLLLAEQPLPHVANDWVLIYKITPEEIHFIRMGTHSDLF